MRTSAIRNLSSNVTPAKSRPSRLRTVERAPSAAMSQSASSRYSPSGVSIVSRTPSLRRSRPTTRLLQRSSRFLQLQRAVDQRLFQIKLLQIDEGGHLVPVLRQQVEGEQKVVAVKHLAELPGDALRHQAFADAEPVENFQRALRPADAARALADAVGIVEENDRHAALRQIDGGGEPDRAGTDDDDRPARDRA